MLYQHHPLYFKKRTTTWHLQRQESLKPSPRSLKRPKISEAPSTTFEPLKTTEPKDLVVPSDSKDLLSAYGDELELVLFDLDSSYTSWWFPKKAIF